MTQSRIEDAPVAGARPARSVLRRIVLVLAALLASWHIFATLLWVAPFSVLREAIPCGNDTLTSWMIPFFGQSWSVFAPAPINGNYAFRVRALVQSSDGSLTTTNWLDAAAVDLSMSQHNLLPPRAANLGVQEASRFKDAWDTLNASDKIITGLDWYAGEEWRTELTSKLLSYGNQEAVVSSYMDQELYATAYATQVAEAAWGQTVIRVQFQVSRQNIPSFQNRNNPNVPPQPVQIAETGWRPGVTLPGQDSARFAEIFQQNLARMGVKP